MFFAYIYLNIMSAKGAGGMVFIEIQYAFLSAAAQFGSELNGGAVIFAADKTGFAREPLGGSAKYPS